MLLSNILKPNNIIGGNSKLYLGHEFDSKWDLNVTSAQKLLDNEFKDLYNQEEKKMITDIVKQPQDCIIWNDFIDTMIYYIRPYNKDKLYYPEKIILTQCYFRKFLINRIQVLTKFYKPNSVILYYGAANSNFLPILINLFPTYTWHIYEDFDLSYYLEENKQNIFLYKEKLSIESAKLWKGKIDVFISDYRRPVNENTILFKDNKIPLQKKIDKMMLDDVFINIDLIKLIVPKLGAAIKFKIMHVDPASKELLEIIKGNILWLPWSSHESTDGTLVMDHKEILYDTKMTLYLSVLQNAYCTHNRYYRPWGYYNIPNKLKIDTDKINGFCHCFDCVCELSTLYNYFNCGQDTKVENIGEKIIEFMNKLSYTLEPLINIKNKLNYHGRFPNLLPATRINKISQFVNIGIYANIDIVKKLEYLKQLKDAANIYDEFSIDLNIKHITEHFSKHNKYSLHLEKNLNMAMILISKKFKNLYSKQEIKLITNASHKINKIPSIWNDLKSVIEYRENKEQLAHNFVYCHLGQRKLFMAELALLNNFFNDINVSAIILYAGAAAGYHLPLLLELFPNTVWHLYDPAPFCNALLKMNSESHQGNKNRRIHIYNEFFTDHTALKWKDKCDIFICDIRLTANDRNLFETQVESDMRSQEKWTLIINPKLGASLKFRPPYLESSVRKYEYKYIRGKIMWQMWPPRNSTECRLIVDSIDLTSSNPYMKIDVIKYQNACAYHNIIDRAWITYEIPNGCESVHLVDGYDRCFDCTCEAICWSHYVRLKNAKKIAINIYIEKLTKITNQKLKNKKSYHGYNQYELPAIRLSKI
jgi:hypothetical protein